MAVQIHLSPTARAPEHLHDEHVREIADDVAYRRLVMVNVVFVGMKQATDRDWVLVDTGLPGSAAAIAEAARSRFGAESRPAAIILTHGHFDHVGALEDLLERWDCPVYAHRLEAPYLTGQKAYPAADSRAGGGMMPKLAPFLPREPVDVSRRLRPLSDDGTLPALPGWRWIHTPGHSEGHVSLWREADRLLIAGDAIVNTGQESIYEVLTQEPEMHGPPRYFTPDWAAAERSVVELARLEPDMVVSGHGRAMQGPEMTKALHHLADNFPEIALPPWQQRLARHS